MAATGRAPDSGMKSNFAHHMAEVLRDLQQAPGEFDFFQAVRLLHQLVVESEPVGTFARPDREPVRFGANPEMSFPPSQIASFDWDKEPATMTVNFMGLTGPSGVLPHCYSELVADRLRAKEKDKTVAAFYDIFNHRIISLFYQAWEKYQFGVVFEREGKERLSRYLLSLVGLGTAGLHNRLDVPDKAILFYTGLLALQPRSAMALESILKDYFEVNVQVEDFVGSWQQLAPADCSFVDEAEAFGAQLGITAVVGDAVWDEQSRIRLKVGPLSASRYLDFLPEGKAWASLKALVSFFCNGETEVELQLILKQDDVPTCQLGKEGEDGPRLGWFTWIKSQPDFDRDPQDTVLFLM